MPDGDKGPDLVKEQAEFIALLEVSMSRELLAAVEQAHYPTGDEDEASSVEISYKGTVDAESNRYSD